MSIFSSVKNLRYKKNAFNLSHDNMFTCDIGQVVPVFVHNDLLPNSDLRVSVSQLSRFQAMLSPLQHKVNAYIHFWKIPYRLLDSDFPDFISGKTMQEGGEYIAPYFTYATMYSTFRSIRSNRGDDYADIPLKCFGCGTLLDMLGYPVRRSVEEIDDAFTTSRVRLTDRPILSYLWLFYERYINHNFPYATTFYFDPAGVYVEVSLEQFVNAWRNHDEVISGVSLVQNGDYGVYIAIFLDFLLENFGSTFFNHTYSKDYFTSALPNVQIGDPVSISLAGEAPVSGSAVVPQGVGVRLDNTSNPDFDGIGSNVRTAKYIMAVPAGHTVVTSANPLITVPSNNLQTATYKNYDGNALAPGSIVVEVKDGNDNTYYQSVPTGVQNFSDITFIDSQGNDTTLSVSGTADLSDISVITINELRVANALQSLKESMARFGTRFNEWLKGFWNQDSSDKTLQLPQWLGGGVIPVHVSDIEQTSATASDSLSGSGTPLGTLAGKASVAGSGFAGFKTHIEEPSLIIGLFFLKPKSVYGNQGLNRHLTKLDDMFDFFNPKTEHLGEQAVKQSELYFTGENEDQTFGYQSRYAEYKYWANEVHGQFMTYLDFWHLGRIFSEPPVLGNDFITIDPKEQKRPFAVQDVDGADISNVMNWLHFETHYLAKMSHFGTPMLLN